MRHYKPSSQSNSRSKGWIWSNIYGNSTSTRINVKKASDSNGDDYRKNDGKLGMKIRNKIKLESTLK